MHKSGCNVRYEVTHAPQHDVRHLASSEVCITEVAVTRIMKRLCGSNAARVWGRHSVVWLTPVCEIASVACGANKRGAERM